MQERKDELFLEFCQSLSIVNTAELMAKCKPITIASELNRSMLLLINFDWKCLTTTKQGCHRKGDFFLVNANVKL